MSGHVNSMMSSVPAADRGTVASPTCVAFASGLDRILPTALIIAFVTGVTALFSIRQKDFVASRKS
jgi:hypothetical protein